MAHSEEEKLSTFLIGQEAQSGAIEIPANGNIIPPYLLQIRSSLASIYPIFILLNAVLFLLAIPFNSYIIIKTMMTKEARNSRVLHLLTNAAICDLFKLICVLPITLANLLLENFVFGSFLCYALPMLQVFPIHVSIITYACLTYDRYRGIRYPDKRRVPAILLNISSWLLAFLSVLPYTGFITYLDLEKIAGPSFQHIGFCFVQGEKNIENYLRATFFLLFLIPLLIIIYLLTRTSWELNFQRKVTAACICDGHCAMQSATAMPNQTGLYPECTDSELMRNNILLDNCTGTIFVQHSDDISPMTYTVRERSDSENLELRSIMGVECTYCASKLQWKDQRRIGIIISLFILSWTPINILILANQFISESQSQHTFMDIITLTLTWFAFLSTSFNPFIMLNMLDDRVQMYQSCHGQV